MPKIRLYRECAILHIICGGIPERLSTYLASHQGHRHMGYLHRAYIAILEALGLLEEVQERAAVHLHLATPEVPELFEEVVDLTAAPPSQLRDAKRWVQGLLHSDLHRAQVVGRSLYHCAIVEGPERVARDLSLELRLEVVCVALQHDAWGLALSQRVSLRITKREIGLVQKNA
jgi:hypothetical protein